MMSYLSDLTLEEISNPQLILSIVKDYINEGKFIEIDNDDNITDYSRFQPYLQSKKITNSF